MNTTTTRNGNLETTSWPAYPHKGGMAPAGEYTTCTVCRCLAGSCTAETCGTPVASDFAPGDTVTAKARGSMRTATVVEVKDTRLVVSYRLKTGEERTSTVPFGKFWRA